jgi:hypothetical protein
MTSVNKSASATYERLVAYLIDELLREDLVIKATVQHLARLKGSSGEEYEVDIAYRFRVANVDYLTVVECKHWHRRVGRNVVAALKTLVMDVGAHKGLIVSTVGFQRGAIGLALKNGIGLLKVTDNQRDQPEVVAHFEGPIADSLWHLSHYSRLSTLKGRISIQGVTGRTIAIPQFFAERFGSRLSEFVFSRNKQESIDPAELMEFRSKMENLGNWMQDYLKIEECCLLVEPEAFMDARIARLLIHAARERLGLPPPR